MAPSQSPAGDVAAPSLHVTGLTVSFPTARSADKEVLRGIDFDLAPGEIVGLLGESGCGKSTLALALLRVLHGGARVNGSVVFEGTDLLRVSERRMRALRGARISIIFQEPGLALNPVLRVGTQLTEILRAHTGWDRRRRDKRARALLTETELEGVDRIFDSYPHELSGGQAQRVLIAQALACSPALVIADEPTASLDSTTQSEILALLARLRRERNLGILFITHHPALLLSFADRVLIMTDGRICESGAVPQIFRAPATPFTQALVSAMNRRTMARGARA